MVKEGIRPFYKKYLHATIILPIQIIHFNTLKKEKQVQRTMKPYRGYGPGVCYTLLSPIQFVTGSKWQNQYIFHAQIRHMKYMHIPNTCNTFRHHAITWTNVGFS